MSDHTDNSPIVRKTRRSNGFLRRITERKLGYPGRLIQEFLELKGAELIIDAGSGAGFYTMELAQWLTHGKILALDSSPDMLRELSRCVLKKKYNRRVEALECDLCDIPLADDSAEGVVSLFAWHRIVNLHGCIWKNCTVWSSQGERSLFVIFYGMKPIKSKGRGSGSCLLFRI